MKRLKGFVKTSVVGGLVIILPVALLFAVFTWIFNFITKLIQPFTNLILKQSETWEFVADLFVILIILLICFFVGLLVRTKLGKYLHRWLEDYLLLKIPGYNLIKETILQFIGDSKTPFSSVALVNIFCNETLVTSFVTDEHDDGSYTVFVPTGPNPTSGNIFHVKAKYVHKVNVPVEETMRSIISCGSGSLKLIDDYKKQIEPKS